MQISGIKPVQYPSLETSGGGKVVFALEQCGRLVEQSLYAKKPKVMALFAGLDKNEPAAGVGNTAHIRQILIGEVRHQKLFCKKQQRAGVAQRCKSLPALRSPMARENTNLTRSIVDI